MNRSIFSYTTFVVCRLAGIVVVATAFLPSAASAAITVTLPSLSLPESSSSQTGTFDVFTLTSGGSLPEVGDFTVNLQVSPVSGVDFTGGGATTANPYIFAGQSAGPMVATFNSGTTIEGTDEANNPPTLVNNDGLLAVNYFVPANTSGTFNLTIVTTGPAATTLDDQNVNPIPFTTQNTTLTVVPSAAYWNGGIGTNWNTLSGASYATNWSTAATGGADTHALPGTNTDVFFTTSGGGSNLGTTLGANFSIKGLSFTSAATSPVSISGQTLTIGADGLTVQSGAAATTINSGVTLSSNQTWTIGGSNPLTINGTLSLAGLTLTKAGSGTVRVDAAPALANGSTLNVTTATVQLDVTSGSAMVGTNVTATVSAGATLQLAGTVSALSDGSAINPSDGNLVDITNTGSTASGGGLQVTGTNQSVGIVSGQTTTTNGITTYGGDTVVGNGSAASLTVSQLLQNTLTIGAGSTVTIRPSGPGFSSSSISAGASVSASGSSIAASISPSGGPSAVASIPAVAANTSPAILASGALASVQNSTNSSNNSSSVDTPSATTTATASAASIDADVARTKTDVDTTSAIMAVVGSGSVSPSVASSLLASNSATAVGMDASVTNSATLVSTDDEMLLLSPTSTSLAFSDSAGFATFGMAMPAVNSVNSVPEPSSLVLLILGGAIPLVLLRRTRTAAS